MSAEIPCELESAEEWPADVWENQVLLIDFPHAAWDDISKWALRQSDVPQFSYEYGTFAIGPQDALSAANMDLSAKHCGDGEKSSAAMSDDLF